MASVVERYADEFEVGWLADSATVDDLVDSVIADVRFWRASQEGATRHPFAGIRPGSRKRADAVAVVFADAFARAAALRPWAAVLAAAEPDVIRWRWNLAGDDDVPVLLRRSAVDGWIRARLAPDFVADPLRAVVLGWEARGRWTSQAVPRPTMKGDRDVPLAVLGELAVVAQRLAVCYSWEPGPAAMFVLTGEAPEVVLTQSVLVHRSHKRAVSGQGDGGLLRAMNVADVRAFDRVEALLDPALTPEQVAVWWRDVHDQMREQDSKGLPGAFRSPGSRQLAEWAAGEAGEAGPWRARLSRWDGRAAGVAPDGEAFSTRWFKPGVRHDPENPGRGEDDIPPDRRDALFRRAVVAAVSRLLHVDGDAAADERAAVERQRGRGPGRPDAARRIEREAWADRAAREAAGEVFPSGEPAPVEWVVGDDGVRRSRAVHEGRERRLARGGRYGRGGSTRRP